MDHQASDQNCRRRLCELQQGDRIIVWTSPAERDVMPCFGDSYETAQVVSVRSITSGYDHTYLIDAGELGTLLVYGDGIGGPIFQLAKTIFDRLRDHA